MTIYGLVQLFVFNGTLYFETADEQTAYCQCLTLRPKPRTMNEEEAFGRGWIAVDGFVTELENCRHLQMHRSRFHLNPLTFIKQLIETRNNSYAPISLHAGSIIFNSLKLF